VFFHSTKSLFADIFWPADWPEFFNKDYTVWLDGARPADANPTLLPGDFFNAAMHHTQPQKYACKN